MTGKTTLRDKGIHTQSHETQTRDGKPHGTSLLRRLLGKTTRETMASSALLAAPLVIGMISSAVTGEFADRYTSMPLPPGSPPGWLFPVVWIVLYLLMGVASQRAFIARSEDEAHAQWSRRFLTLHGTQLVLNAVWSPLFFALGLRWTALAVIVAMLGLVTAMARMAWAARRRDIAAMLVPYVAWLSFATYLNAGTAILA